MKHKKFLAVAAALAVLCAVLFYAYEKWKITSPLERLRLSAGEITQVELSLDQYHNGEWVTLDSQQAGEFCSALDGCLIQFRSKSSGFANCCGHAFLYTDSPIPEVEVMFSDSTPCIGLTNGSTQWVTTYTILEGGDALNQYFDRLMALGQPVS